MKKDRRRIVGGGAKDEEPRRRQSRRGRRWSSGGVDGGRRQKETEVAVDGCPSALRSGRGRRYAELDAQGSETNLSVAK